LYFAIRENYVFPQEVNVEEGWFRIVVENPNRVASDVLASIDDEAGSKLAGKPIANQGARTSFYVRIGPGKHRLRIGPKQDWTVQLNVTKKN
jgi:hypothetical protein